MNVTPIHGASEPTPEPDPESSALISIDVVAKQLGVEVRHVRRLVYEGRIPFIKWGHLLRFDPAEIREWVDQYRHQPRRRA